MNIKILRLIKNFTITFCLIFLLFGTIIFQSCEENPNDLGLTLVPSIDTTGVRYLNSQRDTMAITKNNYKQFINTSASTNILIGLYQNYQSKALLKFKDISPDYDSANVVSAILTMKYSKYYFKDTLGVTQFNIYKVNNNFNYSSITFDSVPSSGIGNISLGSFNGIVADSMNILLNNQTVKDWLEYAADTNYVIKNYGIAFIPDLASTTIKGFYSDNNNLNLVPYVTVIYSKNNVLDTITLNISEGVSLTDAPPSIIPSDRIILQNGIAYRNILNFDLTKLPNNVIINNVTLQFTLDNANSFISPATDKRIVIGMVTDSVTKQDNFITEASLLDTINYSVSINSVIQEWNSGVSPNIGITMKNFSEPQNLDNFVIYSPNASDVSKRPRLSITYTLRN